MIGRIPTVFISYAWEDDVNVWVRDLATRLRREGGVDVQIDQWAVALGDPLPDFMERSVRTSDFILIVCTPKYKAKSDAQQGGVGYEGHIITSEIFAKANHRKFIPILRKGEWTEAAPSFRMGNVYLDMRGVPHEATYQQLLSTLHGRSGIPPTIGGIPAFGEGTPVTRSASPDTTGGRGSAQEFAAVAPPNAACAASLPATGHTPTPAPSSPVAAAATPAMRTPIKRSALWPWFIVLAAIILVGSVLFAFLVSRFSDADRAAPHRLRPTSVVAV